MSSRSSLLATPRAFVAWSLAHGIQRRFLGRAAAKGDTMARLATDPALYDDPYPSYEEIRASGRIVRNGLVCGTVDPSPLRYVMVTGAGVAVGLAIRMSVSKNEPVAPSASV